MSYGLHPEIRLLMKKLLKDNFILAPGIAGVLNEQLSVKIADSHCKEAGGNLALPCGPGYSLQYVIAELSGSKFSALAQCQDFCCYP